MEKEDLIIQMLKQYQEQNEKDHAELTNKIDQALSEIHVLVISNNSKDKRLDELDRGQKEIKESINGSVDDLDKRVKDLEKAKIESDHLRNWIIKGLGIATVIIGIVTAVWKLGIF